GSKHRVSSGKLRTYVCCAGMILVVVPALSQQPNVQAVIGNPSYHSRRFFTVRDSIEMARFGRTARDPLFSPDKKFFVVVTSRGLIPSNEIESVLWLFDFSD